MPVLCKYKKSRRLPVKPSNGPYNVVLPSFLVVPGKGVGQRVQVVGVGWVNHLISRLIYQHQVLVLVNNVYFFVRRDHIPAVVHIFVDLDL